jgi:ribosome-binding protein aMBF1 (putative translation factor)
LSTIFVEKDGQKPYVGRMSPEQCRAARGWLGWSQQELADRASVSLSTVRDFEKGRHAPIANNIAAIQRAIEDAGLKPLFDENQRPVGIATLRSPPESSKLAEHRMTH